MMGSRASNQRSTVKFRSFGPGRSQMSMIRSRSTGHGARAAGRCGNGLGRGSTWHATEIPPPPTSITPAGRASSPSEALRAALKGQTSCFLQQKTSFSRGKAPPGGTAVWMKSPRVGTAARFAAPAGIILRMRAVGAYRVFSVSLALQIGRRTGKTESSMLRPLLYALFL